MPLRKIFIILSLFFASSTFFIMLITRPTDLGPRIVPFALPFSICTAGFAIASVLLPKE